MAISLGDAVLAFAGGAATEYNQDLNKRRESDRRMLERAQEMAMVQKQKIAETKFATEYAEQVKAKQLAKTIEAAGGPNSKMGKMLYARETLGLSDEAAAKYVASGGQVNMKFPEYNPEQYLTNLYADFQPSTRQGREGFKRLYDKAQDRQYGERVAPLDDVDDVVNRRGKYGATSFDPIYAEEGTAVDSSMSDAAFDATFLAKNPDYKEMNIDGELVLVDRKTGDVVSKGIFGREKEPTAVESGTYFRNNKTGETIRPTRSGNQYFHGDTPIDIRQYTPVTDDDETRRAERVSKTVEALKARQTALGNLEAGLTAYKQTLTEGTTGATGVAIDVGSVLGATITGVGELLGVDPVTPEEREKLFAEANVDIEDFISGDMAALRGMNVGQAKQLVYSLAGILKEDGDLARTSVADVQNAASMIKDLSSTNRGIGALRALDLTLQTKKASVFQQTYQAQGVDPRTRTQAGINLLRTTLLKDPKMFEKAKKQIMVDPQTGEMSMLYADGKPRTLDQIIMTEGVSGQLRPTLGVRADYNR